MSGLTMWCSPSRRHWYSPPQGRSAAPTGRSGKACACRRLASSAMTSIPMPDTRDAVPEVAIHEVPRSEEHTSELQSRLHLVCRLLLEKKKKISALVLHRDP